jgi:ABC-2 type transport system ATP-binding protein
MTVHGFLAFTAELRGMRGDTKKRAVHRAVEVCFLESVLHQSVETLSKGFRHRTCFAQSILHDPEVPIMDEPTDGLDPNQKHEVRQLIRRMGEKKAIVFSTHILEEVEAACTRAIIIDRGQIVANGTPAELKQRSDVAGTVLVRAAGMSAASLAAKIAQLPIARKTVPATDHGLGDTLRVFPQPSGRDGALSRGLAELAAREGWKLEELHTEEGRLDEVFRSITQPETSRRSQ